MKTTEIDLIDQAADQLKQNTGFKVEINQFSKQDLDAAGFIDTGATRIPIEIYIKKVISTGIIPAIAHKFTGITVQSLVGFGTFEVKERAERTGRNPQTGESITIAAAKVPSFKAGKDLKDAV